MHTSVWTRESNPAIDPPDFNVPCEMAACWVTWGRARWVPNRRGKTTKYRIQLLVEHRFDDPSQFAGAGHYVNAASIEGGTVWRIVGQTPPGGVWPTQPGYQMVP